MSNQAADAALAGMVAQLAQLGQLTRKATPKVADALEGAVKRQIARGTDPDGKAWPRTKEGEQALRGVAKDLVVVPVSSAVLATLRGHVARHNNRTARGGIERLILPKKGLPKPYQKAIADAVTEAFHEVTRG